MSYTGILVAVQLFWQNVGMPIAIQAYCEQYRYSGSFAVILAERTVGVPIAIQAYCELYRYSGSCAVISAETQVCLLLN